MPGKRKSKKEDEECIVISMKESTQGWSKPKRARRSLRFQCQNLADELGLTIRDIPGGDGSNCGYMVLGSAMGVSEKCVRKKIMEFTVDEMRRVELAKENVWLNSDDMRALSISGQDIICMSPHAAAILYSNGKEIALRSIDIIKKALHKNDAILLMNEPNFHFLALDRNVIPSS
jgi:hypothetical protein